MPGINNPGGASETQMASASRAKVEMPVSVPVKRHVNQHGVPAKLVDPVKK